MIMTETGIIYETTHIASGKKYRGQHRCNSNCGGLRGKCGYLGSGTYIKQAVKKHGEDAFRRHTIIQCPVEFLNFYEAWFVDEAWCLRDDSYNLKSGGDQPGTHTEEARANMSRAQTEAQSRPEVAEEKSQRMKKAWQDPEKSSKMRAGISAGHKTEAARANHREAATRRYNAGKCEAFKEVSTRLRADPEWQSMVNKKMTATKNTPESRKRASKNTRNQWADPETRQAMVSGLKEAANRPDVKRRRAEGRRASYARKRMLDIIMLSLSSALDNPREK